MSYCTSHPPGRFGARHPSHQSRLAVRRPKLILKSANPPIDDLHRSCSPLAAAASSAATRTSISLISIAFAVCANRMSAARSCVEANAPGSTMILSTSETAALDAWCNCAVVCPYATRRAFRNAASNSGSSHHRRSVFGAMPDCAYLVLDAAVRQQSCDRLLLLAAELNRLVILVRMDACTCLPPTRSVMSKTRVRVSPAFSRRCRIGLACS